MTTTTFKETCPRCFGTGKYQRYGDCYKCRGTGHLDSGNSAREDAPEVDAQQLKTFLLCGKVNKARSMKIDDVTFSLAPDSGKNPGAVYANFEGGYVGKFHGGKFYSHGHINTDKVVSIARDPRAAMEVYGIETGKCACCGGGLTNSAEFDKGVCTADAARYGV